jgi:hypothetical protein
MRNLLAFLAALILTFLGLGYYLDWYRLGTKPASAGHREVTIDINTVKIGKDLEKAEEGVKHKVVDSRTQPTAPEPSGPDTNWLEPAKKEGHHHGQPASRNGKAGTLEIDAHDIDKWLENR